VRRIFGALLVGMVLATIAGVAFASETRFPHPFEVPEVWTYAASDRPPGHPTFAIWGAVLLLLFLCAVWAFGRARWRADAPAGAADEPPRTTAQERRTIAVIVAGAALLRLATLKSLPLGDVEWNNVEFFPFADVMWNGFEVMTNPPLLLVLQHFVYPITTDLFWIRIPVCIFGVVAVWATWRAGRTIFSPSVGLTAALLMAVHAGAITWSQTVRYYGPATTFIILALPHAYMLTTRRSMRHAAMLGLFGTLAYWSHYTAFIPLLLMFVAVAWSQKRSFGAIRDLVVAGVGMLLAFLPLVPFFFFNLDDGKQGWGLSPYYFRGLVVLATGMVFHTGWFAVALLLISRVLKARGARWLVYLLVGFVAMTVLTRSIIFWEFPYCLSIVPLAMLLVAASLHSLATTLGRRFAAAGALATAGLMLVSTTGVTMVALDNYAMSGALRPILNRQLGIESFADEIAAHRIERADEFSCAHLMVVPPFELDSYLYYLGPVTPADSGGGAMAERGGTVATMPLQLGERGVADFHLHGSSFYGAWHTGMTPLLEDTIEELGCFWYGRSRQNCQEGTGDRLSTADCDWLGAHCVRVTGVSTDELHYCRPIED